MDGKDITEEIAVPKATSGEDNYDDYNNVSAKVNLTKGEHILRFTVTGDWMDIDYIEFTTDGVDPNPVCKDEKGCESNGDKDGVLAEVRLDVSSACHYDVFSATGKFMGSVYVVGDELSLGLKNAGFAKGVYMVRSAKGLNTAKVQVK
ncbi:MAG: carbohydrate-binding protein, partial [Fibrobacter sp.]|nr:carbohydrate-binding protein [Fibrobacter sp.]